MRLLRAVRRYLVREPVTSEPGRWVVWQNDNTVVAGAWEKRILDLADGRTVGEIARLLCNEEMRGGAAEVYIGLWKRDFESCVASTVLKLMAQDCLSLEQPTSSVKEQSGTETEKAKVT